MPLEVQPQICSKDYNIPGQHEHGTFLEFKVL